MKELFTFASLDDWKLFQVALAENQSRLDRRTNERANEQADKRAADTQRDEIDTINSIIQSTKLMSQLNYNLAKLVPRCRLSWQKSSPLSQATMARDENRKFSSSNEFSRESSSSSHPNHYHRTIICLGRVNKFIFIERTSWFAHALLHHNRLSSAFIICFLSSSFTTWDSLWNASGTTSCITKIFPHVYFETSSMILQQSIRQM